MNKLFLLSKKEYIENKEFIQSESHWWLRTPRHNHLWHDYSDMCYVHSDGDICYAFAYDEEIGVRPAFKFKIDQYAGVMPGSVVHFGKINWIKLKDGIYLSKDIVFNYRFDKKGDIYDESDIKRKLRDCESWWFINEELIMLEDFDEDE